MKMSETIQNKLLTKEEIVKMTIIKYFKVTSEKERINYNLCLDLSTDNAYFFREDSSKDIFTEIMMFDYRGYVFRRKNDASYKELGHIQTYGDMMIIVDKNNYRHFLCNKKGQEYFFDAEFEFFQNWLFNKYEVKTGFYD